MLDTRTQRYKDDEAGLEDNHLLGRPPPRPIEPRSARPPAHLAEAQQTERGDAPKFIVTLERVRAQRDGRAHPPAPARSPRATSLTTKRAAGKERLLAGLSRTRRRSSNTSSRTACRTWCSWRGDIHCANVAELEFDGPRRPALQAFVVSSAFYWPFPFADGDPTDYVHDSTASRAARPLRRVRGGDDGLPRLELHPGRQLRRLTVDKAKNRLVVRYYDRDGALIEVLDANDKKVKENVLPLA